MELEFSKVQLPDGRVLGGLKVKDLKVELEKRRLSKSGNKDDLFRRLGLHLASENTSPIKESNPHQEKMNDDSQEERMNENRSRSESPVNNASPDRVSSKASAASDVQREESIHSLEENDKVAEIDEPDPSDNEGEEIHADRTSDLDFEDSEDFAVKEVSNASLEKSKDAEKQEDEVKSLEEGEVEVEPIADESNNDLNDSKASLKRTSSSNHVDVDEEEPVKRSRSSLTNPQTILNITVEKDSPESATIKAKRKGPKDTVVVGYLLEKPERLEPSQSVSTAESNIVSIRHLVRPFTDKQLRQILQEYGSVTDLWLDKIKSKAYVVFQMEEDAKKCRDELDGCRWPSINTKALRTDYATQAEYNWMVQHGDSGQTMPRNLRGVTTVSRNSAAHKGDSVPPKMTGGLIITVSEDDRKYSSKNSNRTMQPPEPDETVSSSRKKKVEEEHERRRHSSRENERERERKPSREKELTERRHENSSSKRRSRSREKVREKTRSHQLTDLFRKTIATPALFWKTVEESVVKARRTEQTETNKACSKPSEKRASEPSSSKQRSDPQRR